MNILINNNYDCHYEIVESVFNKLNLIIKNENLILNECNIYIFIKKYKNYNNHHFFIEYIKEKYPKIKLLFSQVEILSIEFDYTIMCSFYPECKFCKPYFQENSKKHYYICHDVTIETIKYENIYYLTPLNHNNRYFYCDILPYIEIKKKVSIPIYIIQGDIKKRSLKLLLSLLKCEYSTNFIIKILCNNELPNELLTYSKKIIVLKGLNFKEYHMQFTEAYGILPLCMKEEQPYYYTTKLTSTINYALGYDLKIIIDKDLNDIYNMKNSYIFNNYDDINEAFNKSLNDFTNNINYMV
jgi:hypothetical protein